MPSWTSRALLVFEIRVWLWKKYINSDGQQFHQYQQNEHYPLTLTYWTQKKTTTYDDGNPGAGWDRLQIVAVLNWLMRP
jgi:hypothetical protein